MKKPLKPKLPQYRSRQRVLKYYEVFALMQGAYCGIKLLIEVPQLIVGMAKMYQMFKLANKGNPELLKLIGGVAPEMEKLDAQLKAYMESLEASQKAKLELKMAKTKAKL